MLWSTSLAHGPKDLIDVGAGCGIVGIELANRLASVEKLTLLECQEEFVPYLEENRKLLRRGVEADSTKKTCLILRGTCSFELVVSNPPYFKEGSGRRSSDERTQRCRSFYESGPSRIFRML